MNLCERNSNSVETALCSYGWKQAPGRPNRFAVMGMPGPVRMRRRHVHRNWVQLAVVGRLHGPAGASLLHANAELPGPWKYAIGAAGAWELRADFPRAVEEQIEIGWGELPTIGNHQTAADAWVNDLSAFVLEGRAPVLSAADTATMTPAKIAKYLEERGWAAAADGDVTRVTVTIPQLFQQVTVDQAAPGGPWIHTPLVDLAGWPDVCRRAAEKLSQAANARLPLVRFSATGPNDAEKLQAEVRLGNVPRLPGVWLEAALETLRSAITLCARELAALREPELAELVLAGNSADEPKGK